ncbi:hypothetical protein INT44_000574 [Umbelopsis vinacea]|uniref:Uncharacterized protein n=1 Tax=Umbelopsis vinacea TaxID=44442 RepID=A0A8H7PLT3_9FUNG|nr:hypothetical protein INT44_000574 [Umbelopsis vinacea]
MANAAAASSPKSPISSKANNNFETMEQPFMKRKTHTRMGSAPPDTEVHYPQPPTQAVESRNGSLSYTNSYRRQFLSSSASSMTGTSIRTELDGSVIFHPDEEHPGKMYWESLFQPDRSFNRRPPRHPRGMSLQKSNSVYSFASAATNPQLGSAMAGSNVPPRTTPDVNRYDVLTNIKGSHHNEKPIDKKQFEKLISQEKGLNDDSYNDDDLKAIYTQTTRSKSSPPSLLEEGLDDNTEVDLQYGKWYFWAGFICPLFWVIGGTYPARGRKNRAHLTWRRRNRAAFTVFMTLLVILLIVGLVLKPDVLGLRTSSPIPPSNIPNTPDSTSSDPKNPNAPVNAADARP